MNFPGLGLVHEDDTIASPTDDVLKTLQRKHPHGPDVVVIPAVETDENAHLVASDSDVEAAINSFPAAAAEVPMV